MPYTFFTVTLLLYAVDWIVLIMLIIVSPCLTSNWEIKTSSSTADHGPMMDNMPNDESVKVFNDYGGIVPIAYEVTLRAPVDSNGVFRQLVEGSVTITFICQRPMKYIYLNARELSINTSSVMLTVAGWKKDLPLTTAAIAASAESGIISLSRLTIIDSEHLAIELSTELHTSQTYTLTIGKFSGPIKGGNSEGFFGVPIHSNQQRANNFLYATQFQLNNARTVFPCVDSPRFKSNFTLKLEHSVDYSTLSNGIEQKTETVLVAEAAGDKNLLRTTFEPTPPLPTYTVAVVLFPTASYRRMTQSNIKLAGCWRFARADYYDNQSDAHINISLHFNPDQFSDLQAALLLKYAEYAYCFFDRQWSVTLPLKKLDLVVLPQLVVYGMENWALITLNEEYLLRISDDAQFSLIAHEVAHHWIGNYVTIQSWTYLCFQEGLTEHYARRVVKDYYISQNKTEAWLMHLISRYLPAMRAETDDDSSAPLLQSGFSTVTDVARLCFNRAPFVAASLEYLTGTLTFDTKVAEYLRRFALSSVVFDDFVKFFETSTIGDKQLARVFRYSFEHAGYPCLFVKRFFDNNKRITLERHQYVKRNRTHLERVPDAQWPMAVYCTTASTSSSSSPMCDLRIFDQDTLELNTTNITSDDEWILFNEEFKMFYRVNYDAKSWRLLSSELTLPNCRFSLLTQIQLVNDFCFFRQIQPNDSEDVVDETTRNNFNSAFSRLQQTMTGVNLQMYIPTCANTT